MGKQTTSFSAENENRYYAIFENSPVSIWEEDFSAVRALFDQLRQEGVRDLNAYFDQHPQVIQQCVQLTKIIDVNKAALKLHRANSKEELLAGLINTFTPESFVCFREELVCMWQGKTSMEHDAVVKTLDGEPRQVVVNYLVCPGHEETLSKVFVSLIDISERKQVEKTLMEKEWRYRSLAECIPENVIRYDRQGRVTYLNPALEKLLGINAGGRIGKRVREFHTDGSYETYAQFLDKVLETGEDVEFEFVFPTKGDDSPIYLVRMAAEREEEGAIIGALAISHDITDYKRATAALSASELQFRSLAENSPDNIARYDRQCRMIYCNARLLQNLGTDVDAVIGKTPLEFEGGKPESRAEYEEHVRQVLESGESDDIEMLIPDADGSPRIHLIRFSAEYDNLGQIVGVLAIGRDITELRQAEKERQQYTEFLTNMDRINRAIQGADDLETMMRNVLDEVRSIFSGDRVALIYPCDPDAAAWRVLMQRTHPDWLDGVGVNVEMPMTPEVMEMHRISLQSEHPFPYGYGTDLPIPDQVEKFGDKSGLAMAVHPKVGKPWSFVIIQCSYNRRWTEEEQRLFEEIGRRLTDGLSSLLVKRDLRESEAKLRRIVDTAREGILILDERESVIYINAHLAKLLGYTQEELQGRKVTEFIQEEDLADHLQRVSSRHQNIAETYERRLFRKDGSIVWVMVSAAPISDGDRYQGVLAMVTDITEHKRMEEELRNSEKRFHAIFEQSFQLIGLLSSDGILLEANQAALKFADSEKSEVIGKPFWETPWWRHSPPLQNQMHDAIREVAQGNFVRFEATHLDAAGKPSYIDFTLKPISDSDGKVIQILPEGRDITAIKQAEEQRQLHADLLANLDRINISIQGAGSLEQMMSNVLDEVLAVFKCERAFLMFPCDPSAQSWTVPMERTCPEYPGVGNLNEEVPMDEEVAKTLKLLLEAPGALRFGPGSDLLLPMEISDRHSIRSFMSIAIRPKTGKPWQFGIHQCSYDRIWSDEEIKLFEEIGRRLSDSLTSLLILRDLRESEAKYRRIFDTAIEGIWGQDENYVTTFANARMAEMLDYSVQELSGHRVTDFMFEKDVLDHQQKLVSRRNHQSDVYERRFRRKDGTTLWTLISATPIFDTEGTFKGSFAMVTDITERKQSEEKMLQSDQRLRLHAELSPLGFLEWDKNFCSTEWNAACEKIFGYSREEAIGRHAKDLILPPEVRELVDGIYRDLMNQTGGTYSVNENITKDGRTIVCEWFNTTLVNKDGKAIGVASIVRDITEQKHREDELKRYRNHLEEVVLQRTEQLRLARDEAEAANKAKSVFLANMSHELRTPLNSILGFSQVMQHDSELSNRQHETIEIINSSGEHLLKLINDVLEIAKIEAGKMQLETTTFNLQDLVREVCDMMLLRAQQKGLQLELDFSSKFPRYIKGDKARLRQILVNLVSNAVKFTEKGGVTIRMGVKRNTTGHLLLEVEDTGPGISQSDHERLFIPFEQLPEGKQQVGSGLGLSIVQKFVELMGGKIKVKSAPGEGSLFCVELPLEAATDSEVVQIGVENHGKIIKLEPGQPSYRILIAEDQRDNQLLLTNLMTDIGLEVKVADNGEECVRVFEEWMPDLIWMDKRMPVLDGVQATQRIRHMPNGKTVKIVAVTATAFKEQESELLDAGMDDYIRKPYRIEEIYAGLSKHLGLKFIYSEETETKTRTDKPLDLQGLLALDSTLLEELRQALQLLDRERIVAAIHSIASYDKEIGQTLTRMADDFDYPNILSAIDQIEGDNY